MLLAVDIGNTQTNLGVFDNHEIRFSWRLVTERKTTGDELRAKLHTLLQMQNISANDITGIIVSSVVPTLLPRWQYAFEALIGMRAQEVSRKSAEGLLTIAAAPEIEIGADRIADVVGAIALYGAPVIVVDLGTATNIEVIDKEGALAGCAFAPGVETSMNALFSNAALLSAVQLEDPQTALGNTTTEALQIGLVYGEADRIDGLVHRVWDQLGYETPVVATGGLVDKIAPFCSTVTATNIELTLQGLRLIYEAHTTVE